MTLVEFLLARIAEDEEVARAAGSGSWKWEQGYGDMCNDPECSYGQLMQVKTSDPDGMNGLTQLMSVHGYDTSGGWEGAEQIARWNPARVLADCAAKRHTIELCENYDSPIIIWEFERILKALARPYASHADFDADWALS